MARQPNWPPLAAYPALTPWPWVERPDRFGDVETTWSPEHVVGYKVLAGRARRARRARQGEERTAECYRNAYWPSKWTAQESVDTLMSELIWCEKAPTLECTCGIYLFKDRASADREHEVQQWWNREAMPLQVQLWRVEAWGTVIEHETGYRAEHVCFVELLSGELEARHIYVGGPYHGERVEEAAYASSTVRVPTVGRYIRQDQLVDGTVLWLWTEGNE